MKTVYSVVTVHTADPGNPKVSVKSERSKAIKNGLDTVSELMTELIEKDYEFSLEYVNGRFKLNREDGEPDEYVVVQIDEIENICDDEGEIKV